MTSKKVTSKRSADRSSGPKGADHKAGPKMFFKEKPARSYGQRSHVKKSVKTSSWKGPIAK